MWHLLVKKLGIAFLIAGIFLVLNGCGMKNPGEPDEFSYGVISLNFNLSDDLLKKTIEPNIDMEVAEFEVSGYGPDSATFSRTNVTIDSIHQASLSPGSWIVTVDGYNASGVKIGTGSTTVEIVAGETKEATITVSPLAGNGALVIDISWPANVLTAPSVIGSLTAIDGTSQSISFTMAGDNLSANSLDSLSAGYYEVSVQLLDNGTKIWGRTEAAFIVTGGTSSQGYVLTQDVNQSGLSVVIQDSIQQPIDIAFTGVLDTLTEGQTMTVTAIPAETVESYQWYLGGDQLNNETNASITIGDTLSPGNYWLDIIIVSGKLYSSHGIKFSVIEPQQTAMGDDVSIRFLHHSTGGVIWSAGVSSWFTNYNSTNSTNYQISEQEFPKRSPYGWNNYPYDYWNIWVNNAGNEPYIEEPTLEILTQTYDVIVWKHCFPVSNLLEDTGTPDITSSDKRIENYKLQYEALKTKMHEFPDQRFVVWTGAALTQGETNEAAATRAQSFFNWVRTEWDIAGDNIYLWDFWTLETEGGIYMLDEHAAGLTNSHPNSEFAAEVAPYFAQRVVDVIEGKGDTGSLTGQ